MAINTTFEEPNKEGKPFPKLMINKDLDNIILATSCGTHAISGTVVMSSIYEIGHTANSWSKNDFEDYNETVTLKNQ